VRFLLFGEINLDIILHGCRSAPEPGREVLVEDFLMALGSSCAITGAALVKLGNEVTYLGKAGADFAGEFCLERMAALGMDVSRVKLEPELRTGVTVSVTSRQDRTLISYLGATTVLTEADIDNNEFDSFQHLHSSSYFLQTGLHPGFENVYARAKEHGLTTSLDPACDPTGKWNSSIDRVLRYVDVFLPNELELESITGEKDVTAAVRTLDNGNTLTVAKLGSRGAMTTSHGEPLFADAPVVEPVDPTGAGDCFNAGFLHAWIRRRPLSEALRLAVACGSFSTQALGGSGAQPTEYEAEAFLENCTGRATKTG
jgi:sugar/nucleoside kinase (ribokinase family)